MSAPAPASAPIADPAARPPFSVLAIIAFILSFIVTVVGLVLGIVALIQTKRTGARGSGLAVAAIILGALFTVGWIVGGLAILAGTVFLGQQSEARDAATQSDLGNAKIAMIEYATENNGVYPTSVSDLADYGFTPSEASARLSIRGAAGEGLFCLQAISPANHFFHITDSSGVESGPCAP